MANCPPKYAPNTYLPLSAVGDLLPEDLGPAAIIERELGRLADDARAIDTLIDYVWAPVLSCEPPADVPPGITEAELRALWGDR